MQVGVERGQLGPERREDLLVRHLRDAADVDRDGVRGASRDRVAEPVADALHARRDGDHLGLELDERDGALEPHEIRGGEEVEVQRMALQRLAVLGEQSEPSSLPGDDDPERGLGRAHGGEAVTDGAESRRFAP